MGMYSYFVMAEPSNFSIDISKIPKHLQDYFFGDLSGTITLEDFGKLQKRIKFLGYLTLENANRWKELFIAFQRQASEKQLIRLHFCYEETTMFFIQSTSDEKVDIFVGEYADSKYCVLKHLSNPSLKSNYYSMYDSDDEEDFYIHLPLYLKCITDEDSSFKRIDFSKLQRDPIYMLFR